MSNFIKINVNTLNQYKNNFTLEKEGFERNRSSFSNSYLNYSHDYLIDRMRDKLLEKYDRILNGYNKINDWWHHYLSEVVDIENALSHNGNSVSESLIRNKIMALPDLTNYDSDSEDISFHGYFSPNINDMNAYYAWLEEADDTLLALGLCSEDIFRIKNGSIKLEDLLIEIEKDPDDSRRRRLQEAVYFSSFGLNFNNMDEYKSFIEKEKSDLNALYEERNELIKTELNDYVTHFVLNNLYSGFDLDTIINSGEFKIGYKKTVNGVDVIYLNDDPSIDPKTMQPIYVKDYISESEIKKLKKELVKKDNKYYIDSSNDTLATLYEESENNIGTYSYISSLKDFDDKIAIQDAKFKSDEYNFKIVNDEINCYMDNVASNIYKDDFLEYSTYNRDSSTIKKIFDRAEALTYDNYPTANLKNGEKDKVINYIINGVVTYNDGLIKYGNDTIQIALDTDLSHFSKWASIMTVEERSTFNYLYNTGGDYMGFLNNMSGVFDVRYDAKLCQEDSEFASNHALLASASSHILSRIEGVTAFAVTINSMLNDSPIYRTDIHSQSSNYRTTVSSNINEAYGNFASLMYDTGYSMTDTVFNVGLAAITGGGGIVAGASAATSIYGSELYSGKTRGLTDSQAINLAAMKTGNEFVFETIGSSKFLQVAGFSKTAPWIDTLGIDTSTFFGKAGRFVGSGLEAASVNVFEEEGTDILNYLADKNIALEKSEYQMAYYEALRSGKTRDEAYYLVRQQFINDRAYTAEAAFLSGMFFGSFSSTRTAQIYANDYASRKMQMNDYLMENKPVIFDNNSINEFEFNTDNFNDNNIPDINLDTDDIPSLDDISSLTDTNDYFTKNGISMADYEFFTILNLDENGNVVGNYQDVGISVRKWQAITRELLDSKDIYSFNEQEIMKMRKFASLDLENLKDSDTLNMSLYNGTNNGLVANKFTYNEIYELADAIRNSNGNFSIDISILNKYNINASEVSCIFSKALVSNNLYFTNEEITNINNYINQIGTNSNTIEYINYSDFVDEYKEESSQLINNLTNDQDSLVNSYTAESNYSSYSTINSVLRGNAIDYDNSTITLREAGGSTTEYTFDEYYNEFQETPEEFVTRTRQEADTLNEIISQTTLKHDTIFGRGTYYNALEKFGISEFDSEEVIREKLLGKTYVEDGMMSVSPMTNSGFMQKDPVNMIINCKEGTPFLEMSKWNSGEQEVLLQSGNAFSIDNVEKTDGKLYIYMTIK